MLRMSEFNLYGDRIFKHICWQYDISKHPIQAEVRVVNIPVSLSNIARIDYG